MDTFAWLYVSGFVLIGLTEALAILWQGWTKQANVTLSEKFVPIRDRLVVSFFVLPWVCVHLLFAPSHTFGSGHQAIAWACTGFALAVALFLSSLTPMSKPPWKWKAALTAAGVVLGWATPIP